MVPVLSPDRSHRVPDTEVWATNLDRSNNKGKAVTMKVETREGHREGWALSFTVSLGLQ